MVSKPSIQEFATGKLTTEEFDTAISAFPRMSKLGINAARYVLVDGLSQRKVSFALGIHRQQINRWVKLIYAAHCKCPTGWEMDVVMLPPLQMAQVKEMEREAMRGLE